MSVAYKDLNMAAKQALKLEPQGSWQDLTSRSGAANGSCAYAIKVMLDFFPNRSSKVMKVGNLTLPTIAMLVFSGSSIALAGSSYLDPYAYIQAPTKAEKEREQTQRFKKKIKPKKVAKESPAAPVPSFTSNKSEAAKPAKVILSSSSPKLEDEKKPSKPSPVQSQSTASADSESNDGFMGGLKQSTDGIAKSAKAVTGGVVNGTKSMGSKIAGGFKVVGGKMKEGTASAGEKIAGAGGKMKEGSSEMGGKVAGTFKSAGGALAVIPRAMGSAAGKLGESSASGAKKLAAAPAAGMSAMGKGFSKLNPFDNDEPAAGEKAKIAQKPGTGSAKAEGKASEKSAPSKSADTDTQSKQIAESQASQTSDEAAGKEIAEASPASEPANQEGNQAKAAESTKVAEAKPSTNKDEKKSAQKLAKKSKPDSSEASLTKKLAAAPMDVTKKGLDATKASVGAISQGFSKLNPFRKDAKGKEELTASKKKEELTASKEKEKAAPAIKPESEAEKNPAENIQLGERIQPDENEANGKEQTAAGEGVVPN